MSRQGIVFNIQRFTIHDGPGLRTELFLKGCPLRCRWCSNPESWLPQIQLGVYKTKCIGKTKCGMCLDACPVPDTLQFYRGKLVGIDRDKCTTCMACYDECPSDAIKQWGKAMRVEECMKEIMRDVGYYERSGGGVTVSGGEPLLQKNLPELLQALKQQGVHTAVDTAFCVPWERIAAAMPHADLFLTDIKAMDGALHRELTGVDNALILANIRRLAESGKAFWIRVPVIPGLNTGELPAIADFVRSLNRPDVPVELIPYHNMAGGKYASLGKCMPLDDLQPPKKEEMDVFYDLFAGLKRVEYT